LLSKAISLLSISLLVLRGADIHLINFEGATTLMIAAQQGHLEVIQFLVERGAVVDQAANDESTTLAQASFTGHLDVVNLLMSKGATFEVWCLLDCLLLMQGVSGEGLEGGG
jgi:ankyrin repeat protein